MDNLRGIIVSELLEENIVATIVPQISSLINSSSAPLHSLFAGKVERNRNINFYEETILKYSDYEFHRHFRMSRSTFLILLHQIEERRDKEDLIPLRKKLLYAIWVLAKQETFFSVGNLFNFSESSGHGFFLDMVESIVNLKELYIRWPNNNEKRTTSRVLEEQSGIPGVVGLIDGSHIDIKAPPHNEVDYYNRNNYHSIILQGVCDEKKRFIDIFVGMPGRVHDARVFRQSALYDILTNPENNFLDKHEHLLGDKAYPLLPTLLTPYRDNGHLNLRQKRYNTKLSINRSLIERAYSRLKGKWRRLKYLDVSLIRNGCLLITAACVLHNLIIDEEGGESNDSDSEEDEVDEGNAAADNFVFPANDTTEGSLKRDFIAAML